MNVHHLELFFYVAKHGGISEAARHMPYGIQQPAISAQVIQLEEFLGVTLFRRRPFALTPSGEELYRFVEPFFGRLETVARKLQGGTAHHLRVGAAEIVLRDHLPILARAVQKKFPRLKFTLRQGYQSDIETWLERHEIDLGLTPLGQRPPAGINAMALARLPLALIVPKQSPLKSADALWKQDRIEEALITLPAHEALCRHFQQGLRRKGIDWFPSIEVSSLKLIETYVANGFGVGLFLQLPNSRLDAQVRPLPLLGFEPVTFGVLWQGQPTPLAEAFLEAVRQRAKDLLA
jgi:DNA-binding transcriptional LysR family regulator